MTEEKKRMPCDVYSRVVGYLRPISMWAKHKQHEFYQRKTYSVAKAIQGVERRA